MLRFVTYVRAATLRYKYTAMHVDTIFALNPNTNNGAVLRAQQHTQWFMRSYFGDIDG